MTCWFEELGGCSYRADGMPDRMHLIPKQRLRQAGLSEDDAWDTRVWRFACRKHHHEFDNGKIQLDLADYPDSTVEFAAEHGFEWFGIPARWRKASRA